MDPNACMDRILSALAEQDWEEASDALSDLHRWPDRGGFAPEGGKLDTLQVRMEGIDPKTCPASVCRAAVRLDVVQGPVLEQTSGLWSGIREVPAALRGTAEPILFHIRGRGWFYVLVHAGTALLCSPSRPYHGPYPTQDKAIESALSW